MKPFLKFQKIPPAALGPVRRVVDADDEFRGRVGLVATEELVGRAGLLWIHRPDGWEDELAGLVAVEQAAGAAADADRAERSAQKRLDAAELAARSAIGELATVRSELMVAREQRRATEHERERLERRAAQLEIELGGARRRLSEADGRASEAEAALARLQVEVAELRHELATLEKAASAHAVAFAGEAEAEQEAGADPVVVNPAVADPAVAAPSAAAALPAGLGAALSEAADATRRLTAALAAASAAVGAEGDVAEDRQPSEPASPPALAPSPTGRSTPAPRARRTPLPLPGGMWADAPEAAVHLVRSAGAILVVDGYNVAKLGWPELALAEQRNRLLDALDELAARYGTDVRVVFDGADVERLPVGRRYLRVDFSAPGVTADEVIIELAASLPGERPVVVATNDGEVRAGTRAEGANVISSEQLLAVARR